MPGFRAGASTSFVRNLRNNLFRACRLAFEFDVADQVYDNLFDVLGLELGGMEHVLSHNGYLNTERRLAWLPDFSSGQNPTRTVSRHRC
jgi:hypothetical protein